MKSDYMEDCIHLKACRRMCKLRGWKKGYSRGCDDMCSAYQSADEESECVTEEVAIDYARCGTDSIRSGYSEYSIYCLGDMPKATIGQALGITNN